MKKTILIIDDEPDIRQSMSDIFSDEGYNVITAEDGNEALSQLEKETPDLIFLDIWLPDSDGLKLLPGLKKEHPQVPVIMISGHGTIETAVQATKLGAFDFIEKPLSLDKLVITASNALTISRLREENIRLRKRYNENRLIGECRPIIQLKEQIRIIAPTDGWVLIVGENGTGKELVAREIHRLSSREKGPFIEVNCAAIPDNLIESELFGYEKGAFTGAERRQKGKFELSNQGTIFLDEIGDMSLNTQAKILRVLQEKTLTRLGGSSAVPIDRKKLSPVSAAAVRCRLMSASSPPPTRTLKRRSKRAIFARISFSASTSSRSRCRRCVSGGKTSRFSPKIL